MPRSNACSILGEQPAVGPECLNLSPPALALGLQVRKVIRRGGLFVQAGILQVLDNADDRRLLDLRVSVDDQALEYIEDAAQGLGISRRERPRKANKRGIWRFLT